MPTSPSDNSLQMTTTILSPQSKLYAAWRNVNQFPIFLEHVRSVEALNDRRSHWIVDAPMGRTVEWDADIDRDEPDTAIGWHTTGMADVEHQGLVTFRP